MNKACTVVPQAVMHMDHYASSSQTAQTACPPRPARIPRAAALAYSRELRVKAAHAVYNTVFPVSAPTAGRVLPTVVGL